MATRGQNTSGGGDCQRPFICAWGACRSLGLAFLCPSDACGYNGCGRVGLKACGKEENGASAHGGHICAIASHRGGGGGRAPRAFWIEAARDEFSQERPRHRGCRLPIVQPFCRSCRKRALDTVRRGYSQLRIVWFKRLSRRTFPSSRNSMRKCANGTARSSAKANRTHREPLNESCAHTRSVRTLG